MILEVRSDTGKIRVYFDSEIPQSLSRPYALAQQDRRTAVRAGSEDHRIRGEGFCRLRQLNPDRTIVSEHNSVYKNISAYREVLPQPSAGQICQRCRLPDTVCFIERRRAESNACGSIEILYPRLSKCRHRIHKCALD